MIVYIIPLLLAVWGIFRFDINGENKYKNCLYIFLMLYLILLIGLRFEVGGDTLVYMEEYIWRDNIFDWEFSWTDYYEPLYALLCAFTKTVSEDFVYFQMLHSIVINICLFYFIAKSTKYRFSALFFCLIYYYLYFTTEILRESLAIFVFVLNIRNYEEGHWIRYYIGVFIAILFHISAVILLLFPFAKWLRFDWKYVIILVFSLAIFLNLDALFPLFAEIDKINDKITAYEDTSLMEGGVLGLVLTLLIWFRFMILPISIYLWDKFILKERPKYEGLVCIYTILGMGVWFNSTIFERFPNYITPLYMISITNIIIPCFFRAASLSKKIAGIMFFCMILIVYGSFPARIYKRYIPYYSIFNPVSIERIK